MYVPVIASAVCADANARLAPLRELLARTSKFSVNPLHTIDVKPPALMSPVNAMPTPPAGMFRDRDAGKAVDVLTLEPVGVDVLAP